MSIGLMERLPLSFMDRCMSELKRSSGGDALISVCLWKAGYAFTDPGYSFYHWEAKSFDPGPENSAGLLSYLEAAVSNSADQYSLVWPTAEGSSHSFTHSLHLHMCCLGAGTSSALAMIGRKCCVCFELYGELKQASCLCYCLAGCSNCEMLVDLLAGQITLTVLHNLYRQALDCFQVLLLIQA